MPHHLGRLSEEDRTAAQPPVIEIEDEIDEVGIDLLPGQRRPRLVGRAERRVAGNSLQFSSVRLKPPPFRTAAGEPAYSPWESRCHLACWTSGRGWGQPGRVPGPSPGGTMDEHSRHCRCCP